MVPMNADANISVGRPKSLEQSDKDLLQQVLSKYQQASMLPIIESLIAENLPVKGMSEELDPDYFVRKFMQIGLTASKPYDRIMAMEKAARLMGYMSTDNKNVQGVNINFKLHKPADVTDEFINE